MSAPSRLWALLGVLLVGCAPVTRAQYAADAGVRVCAERVACGDLDDEDASQSDCETQVEALALSNWPESECTPKTIDSDKYEQCVLATIDLACDPNLFDGWEAITDCSASEVCSG